MLVITLFRIKHDYNVSYVKEQMRERERGAKFIKLFILLVILLIFLSQLSYGLIIQMVLWYIN